MAPTIVTSKLLLIAKHNTWCRMLYILLLYANKHIMCCCWWNPSIRHHLVHGLEVTALTVLSERGHLHIVDISSIGGRRAMLSGLLIRQRTRFGFLCYSECAVSIAVASSENLKKQDNICASYPSFEMAHVDLCQAALADLNFIDLSTLVKPTAEYSNLCTFVVGSSTSDILLPWYEQLTIAELQHSNFRRWCV